MQTPCPESLRPMSSVPRPHRQPLAMPAKRGHRRAICEVFAPKRFSPSTAGVTERDDLYRKNEKSRLSETGQKKPCTHQETAHQSVIHGIQTIVGFGFRALLSHGEPPNTGSVFSRLPALDLIWGGSLSAARKRSKTTTDRRLHDSKIMEPAVSVTR